MNKPVTDIIPHDSIASKLFWSVKNRRHLKTAGKNRRSFLRNQEGGRRWFFFSDKIATLSIVSLA
jgi:hypothetical protein